MTGNQIPEIAISTAWHEGCFPSRLITTAGDSVEIIHRGTWSHGLGPDFADAMMLINNREFSSGAIEIHRVSRDWDSHGHAADERYNRVMLHLVLKDDGAVARRRDGFVVPVVVLDPALIPTRLVSSIEQRWSRFGGACCAPGFEKSHRSELVRAIHHLGDARLTARTARLEARLSSLPPAAVLWQELLDGLGYSANRDPMRQLAHLVPIDRLDAIIAMVRSTDRRSAVRAVLYGAAGFLPFSPFDAAAAGLSPSDIASIETMWVRFGAPWRDSTLAPTAWVRARVRPANHPAARLAAAANFVLNSQPLGGLVSAVVEPLRRGLDPARVLVDLSGGEGVAAIGAGRSLEIAASVVIPFAHALANWTNDDGLSEAASRAWSALPAPPSNMITRRAEQQIVGAGSLRRIGSRGAQGLLQLDHQLCAPRRCFECPVASLVMKLEPIV